MHIAAAIYINPVKTWACPYMSPERVRSSNPIGSAKVQGRTNMIQAIDSAEGRI